TERAPSGITLERKQVTALLINVEAEHRQDDETPEEATERLRQLAIVVSTEVESYGGFVSSEIGSVWLAYFGVPRAHEDDPERALRAASAIRHRLAASQVPVSAAVATGEAQVRYRSGLDNRRIPPTEVTGGVATKCQRVLGSLRPGETRIRVCDAT